jgi:hypothetical protein
MGQEKGQNAVETNYDAIVIGGGHAVRSPLSQDFSLQKFRYGFKIIYLDSKGGRFNFSLFPNRGAS